MSQLNIQSSKIKCGSCISNIEGGLKEIKGITEINIDLKSNIITIQGDNLDESLIIKRLSELGYPAIE